MFVFLGLLFASNMFSQDWEALGGGANGRVRDMWVDTVTNELYVCGDFTEIGGVPAGGVAKWNGNSWVDLCPDCSWTIFSILKFEGILYISGLFYLDGELTYLAQYDGVSWQKSADFDGQFQLKIFESELYLKGGTFSEINGSSFVGLAKWNGISWEQGFDISAFNSNSNNNFHYLTEILRFNDEIIIGGLFYDVDLNINCLAISDNENLDPLDGQYIGAVNNMLVYKDILYIGLSYGPNSSTELIMAWDGTNFFNPFPNVEFRIGIRDLQIINDELYLLTSFNFVDDPEVYVCAKFDGDNFCTFGGSFPSLAVASTSSPTKIRSYNDEILVLGSPYLFNDTINFIAKWKGTGADSCIVSPVHLSLAEKSVNANLQIHPNPTSSFIQVGFNSNFSGKEKINIYNQLGQLVLSQEITVNSGENQLSLDLKVLQKGIYFVDLEKNSNYQTTKIVKL